MGKTIVLTCLAILFSSKIIAQIDGQRLEKYKKFVLGKYNYKIDSLNEDHYVEYIKDLIKHNDDDSSYKAGKLMTALRLYHFDKYNHHFFAKEIDTIRKRAIENIESNFNGQWRFTHNFISGLSPVLSDYKASDTLNTILFKDGEASFFYNDSLIKTVKYYITTSSEGADFSIFNRSIICWDGPETETSIEIKYIQNKLNLVLPTEYPCTCPCIYNYYKKIF